MNGLLRHIGNHLNLHSPLVLPSMRNNFQFKNSSLICTSFRSKSSQKKWLGRLEYLNRDPDNSKLNKDKDMKTIEKKLNKNNRVYLWGNGELGALGQLGFLHPKARKKSVLKMRRPFVNSLSNYCNVRTVACGYGFTLFLTDHKEKYLFGTGLNDSGQLGYQRRRSLEGRETCR